MRFVWAVVAFVLATVLIGAGIAQRTIFMGPSEQRMELSVGDPEPYVLVDADVLRANEGLQTLLVRGDGEIFVAYGRTSDLTAWLSDTAYNRVTLSKSGKPSSKHVEPVQAGEEDTEKSGRNPAGSDLWLDSFTDEDSLVAEMQLTEGNSVLIARDGEQDAPTDILVSWALDTRTPFAGPLMAAGALLLVVGLVLYVLAIRHQRRGRGPRRKGPGPLPETQPIGIGEIPERPQNDSGTTKRISIRRSALAVPALLVTAALATGCSAESWPQLSESSPTPTPSPTVVAPENQKPPVVGQKQGQRIVSEVATVLEKADADHDVDLAATRLTGAALAGRTTEYALREKIAERENPLTAPRDKVKILLPEATESWPRTVLVLTVSEKDDTVPPVLLTLTQADPWSNYRVADMAEMPASGAFPDVAPAWLGTTRVPAESPFLSLAPAELAGAFSDLVDAGDKSEYAATFDDVATKLADTLRASRAGVVQGLADKGAAETSKASFDMAPADREPLSMATLESGAVVAVSVTDTETVAPTSSEAVIRFGENEEAKALTGATEAAKGVVTTYGLQLFFAVPAQGSNEQIRLLAYHQDLLSVKVIK